MSDVVAMGREAAPPAPSSPTPPKVEERQTELLGMMEQAVRVDPAAAGPFTGLQPFKDGIRPWAAPLTEARGSIQSLDTIIKAQVSGTLPEGGPTVAGAGNLVKAALEDVWKNDYVSSALKAQGETREGINNDLSAGRFEKVVTTIRKTETMLNETYRQALGIRPAVFDKPANDLGKAEPADPTIAQPVTVKPELSTAARAAGPPQQDPIVELVQRLQQASGSLGERDAGLARGINKLDEKAAADPSTISQPMFRTHVAYSLQDTEKALGAGSIPVPAELRSEMTRLAGTSPGLDNKQMEALVRSTPELDDRGLVRDLRRAADSIATLGTNQNSAAVQQHIEALENRVRLAARVTASGAVSASSREPSPSAPAGGETETRAETKAQPEPITSTRSTASPGDGGQVRGSKPEDQHPKVPARDEASFATESSKPKTAMAQIMDNLRSPSSSAPPPWAPSTFAMGERVTKFEQVMGQGKTDQLIRATEKSGVAMMKSIETFSTGPGAEILGKIDAAAGTEPGGLKAVMREMQPGGRYAELRSQFDNALQSDRAFAASYNQVEKTAAQHGKDRLALGADFQAKSLDAQKLDARFQKADEAIGQATERIPGRTPGKSVMEELGQKVAEIFNKAIERVRAMFGREAAPEARASASPGMSP